MSEPDTDPSLPVAYLGIVGPMNQLGFALNPGLGVVYREGIVLLPAQALVLSVQRRKAEDAARQMTFEEARSRSSARVYRVDQIRSVELVRPFTGYRLVVEFGSEDPQRWILQKPDLRDVRTGLAVALGDRFVDSTVPDG